jgi:hypothetical protein
MVGFGIIWSRNTPCRIPGVFCRRKLLSRYRRTHRPHTYADYYLAREQPIRTVVFRRVLYRQRRAARQLLFVEDNARALAWLVTSNLASKNNTLSLSTLLCIGDVIISASEVQQLFSTRSLSDVSWGKVRSLTDWRNAPGRPGWEQTGYENKDKQLGRFICGASWSGYTGPRRDKPQCNLWLKKASRNRVSSLLMSRSNQKSKTKAKLEYDNQYYIFALGHKIIFALGHKII